MKSDDLLKALTEDLFNQVYLCEDENEDMCPSDELLGWIMQGGDDFTLQAGLEGNKIVAKDIEFLGLVFNYYSPIGHLSEERIADPLAKNRETGVMAKSKSDSGLSSKTRKHSISDNWIYRV